MAKKKELLVSVHVNRIVKSKFKIEDTPASIKAAKEKLQNEGITVHHDPLSFTWYPPEKIDDVLFMKLME